MKLYLATFCVDEMKAKSIESFNVEAKEVYCLKNCLFMNSNNKYFAFADELNKIILNFNYDISGKHYCLEFYSLKKYSDEKIKKEMREYLKKCKNRCLVNHEIS